MRRNRRNGMATLGPMLVIALSMLFIIVIMAVIVLVAVRVENAVHGHHCRGCERRLTGGGARCEHCARHRDARTPLTR